MLGLLQLILFLQLALLWGSLGRRFCAQKQVSSGKFSGPQQLCFEGR